MSRRASFLAVLSALVFSPTLLAKAPEGQYQKFDGVELTIHDLQTHLEWMRSVSTNALNWATAEAACSASDAGAGWRLPTVKELQTLVDEEPTMLGATPRYLDPDAFPVGTSPVSLPYWSATKTGNGSEYFAVSFTTGSTSAADPGKPLFVRCVRSVP